MGTPYAGSIFVVAVRGDRAAPDIDVDIADAADAGVILAENAGSSFARRRDARVRYVDIDAAGVGVSADNAFGLRSLRHDCAVSNINLHLTFVRRRIADTLATGKNPAGCMTRVSGPRRLDTTAPDIDGDVTLTMMYLIDARFCSPRRRILNTVYIDIEVGRRIGILLARDRACVVSVESLH